MTVLLRILKITFRHKLRVFSAYLCMAGATASFLVLPYLFGEAIDTIAEMLDDGAVSDRTVLLTAIVILAVGAVRGFLPLARRTLASG